MEHLPTIYAAAVLLPLASFVTILLLARHLERFAAWVATGAILGAGLLSCVALAMWLAHHFPAAGGEHDPHASAGHAEPAAAMADHAPAGHADAAHAHAAGDAAHATAPPVYSGEYYTVGVFGPLRMAISYYIDSLTVLMFCMVTLIASCIHIYAIGYMHDELSEVTDPEVTLRDGQPLRRPGRFPRFFQYLSLFCFSMLGLVLAGNILMVFVFWELVGICSYFLIGFYVERRSASNAANKAFIVNRVGDFGMIIGLMVLWSTLGTFAFGDIMRKDADGKEVTEPGIFSLVRPAPDHRLVVPDGMVQADSAAEVAAIVRDHAAQPGGLDNARSEIAARLPRWRAEGYGYWLLVLGGLGIFCGCVGKSAQFPLHVWLPDAMEGPTPVSALVHSATMVAAGVYLVGRFYPVFAPEVLLVIAIIGTITMLLAASIAFAATDIKRVLAYSTVSQLGLMMLALGVGGWVAGLMHLVTHAFFKSLLFLCSGSVIHAVHTNDLRRMGGLFWKMPVTAITMLVGCLAIAGVAVPFVVGLSGYYSKDAILEQALSFWHANGTPHAALFFVLAVFGAALTTCYMFRMWFLAFVGSPRDRHAYEHAHESPPVMVLPLVILAVLAVCVAWSYQYLGYFAIAAAFFVGRGWQQGWFKTLAAAMHRAGHAEEHGSDHGEAHAGGSTSHTGGSHSAHEHAPAHPAAAAHGDASSAGHGHAEQDAASEPPITWGWLATMLVCTVLGGWVIQQGLGESWRDGLSLGALLEQARPAGTLSDVQGTWVRWTWPNEHASHALAIRVPATLLATGSWLGGFVLAAAFFWWGLLRAEDVRAQFAPLYRLLVHKWWFDELYDALFVQPALVVSRMVASFDRQWIDGLLDGTARGCVRISQFWDHLADRLVVDGLVNVLADWTYNLGVSLHALQTGRIRQYVLFIVVGAIAIFVLISFFWSPSLVG